jgi:hypothetical protein
MLRKPRVCPHVKRPGVAVSDPEMPPRMDLRHGLHQIFGKMRRAFDQVATVRLAGFGDDLRVQPGVVRRRNEIQDLAHLKADPVCIALAQTGHPVGRDIPPVLRGQKPLLQKVEGRLVPGFVSKAMIMRLPREIASECWNEVVMRVPSGGASNDGPGSGSIKRTGNRRCATASRA